MKANGDYALSDVAQLRKRGGPKDLLGARAALLSAAEDVEANSIGAGRAMTTTEQRDFDGYLSQIREISEELAEYKLARTADSAGSGLSPVFPF
jgi:hypothetical protein